MSETRENAVAAKAAGALKASANRHKRAAAFHRRAAKADMEALRELKEACERFGIKFSVEPLGGIHGEGT